MSSPPSWFVISHIKNRATGHWPSLLATSLTDYYWPVTYFAGCFDDNRSLWCSTQWCTFEPGASWTLSTSDDKRLSLQEQLGFTCFVFVKKKKPTYKSLKKLCLRGKFDCPECSIAFYPFVSGCAKNLKYNLSNNDFTNVVCSSDCVVIAAQFSFEFKKTAVFITICSKPQWNGPSQSCFFSV